MPGEDLAGSASAMSGALADLDARLTALEKGGGQWAPGMVAWTTSDTPPPGFLIADGSDFDVNRYAALAVVFPSGTLPDLRDKFPMGAGNLYALLTTGGAATHVLLATESGFPGFAAGTTGSTTPGVTGGPSVASTGAGTSHSHTAGTQTANHTHTDNLGDSFATTSFTAQVAAGASFAAVNNASGTTSIESGTHTHTINPESAHTHSLNAHTHTSAAHTHTVPAQAAANAAAAHSILNPYIALTPLIKF